MESSKKSVFDSFKSKKLLNESNPSTNQWDLKTPEKPINPPRRTRNRGAALSIKEIREAAHKLRKSDPVPPTQTDPLLTAAKEKIPLWPESFPTKSSEKSDSSSKLPEKYELLDEFFRSFDNSIRLLRIKGSATTFANISHKVQCLTDRRFTLSHLAQLKFILPEAIEVKKILIYDEKTSCMKPDLHLALNSDAIESNGKTKSESGNLQLRKVFRARLCDFFKTHPEGEEIPEEVLPEPFNKSNVTIENKASGSSPVSQILTTVAAEQPPIRASHVLSFKRRFSQRVSDQKGEEVTSDRALTLPVQEACSVQQNSKGRTCVSGSASPIKSSSKLVSGVECRTPLKDVHPHKSEDPSSTGAAVTMGTPASVTPSLRETKRCLRNPGGDDSIQSPSKLMRRATRSRSLKFDTPKKDAKFQDDVQECECSTSDDNDLLDCLPETLIQSIVEKERKALLEQDPAISQAKWRQKMIAGLPKLFDMIYFFFQSIRRSIVPKEELMHKIISNNLDIVDRREVEDKLRLLQELVPEWIYEKLASSGDLLICVNKISCPQLIRTRLSEAK